ncbi:unnamed protein product [Periconia digitata]|uniref:Macro domain-containing protein n=1 Tax=Periconia digitata TaxID=1303443 RepID=A0A9W4UTR1_9PLEO|nr:unnamed protein product [Periconia digitata]
MDFTLERTVLFLLGESYRLRNMIQHVEHMDTDERLKLLRNLLCIRSPDYPLPQDICRDINQILAYESDHRTLVSADSIPTFATVRAPPSQNPPVKIKLWKGDITCLRNVTAITNAANSRMLGCFQPTHQCIDNVIHTRAGPQLRQECKDIMDARGRDLPVGHAVTTKAYCLPSKYVIHTVGPQLERGAEPTYVECEKLQQCYNSVLDQINHLTEPEDGVAKSIALCGISTGLFAFPPSIAAELAIQAVASWINMHPDTTLTDIIFVAFTEKDHEIYTDRLLKPRPGWFIERDAAISPTLAVSCGSLQQARDHILGADTVIVTAGAGLSAAIGLDYTSEKLFQERFPTFLQYGFDCLYSVFGFTDWPSEDVRWSYFFTHLEMIRNWPKSELYAELTEWLRHFKGQTHVRTSNADGLFVANGWNQQDISTPQGQYAVLQCAENCTPDSYWPTCSYLAKARESMDLETQRLTDSSAIPACKNCGGDMFICVRAANWFNKNPYRSGEATWRRFRQKALNGVGKTVILEIGVGMNTPGVIRRPDEDLVRYGGGNVRLIRLGLGSHASVPWDLEQQGLATYIDGDIKYSLPMLLRSTINENAKGG